MSRLDWWGVLFQYVGFLSSFWMLGAVGFRYGVVRSAANTGQVAGAFRMALRGAAVLGAIGAVLGAVAIIGSLHQRADAKHMTLAAAASAGGMTLEIQIALLVVLLAAFLVASRRETSGWPIAATAALAYALRGIVGGRLAAMVNPLHVLGASLWIGTLFVLVVCGVSQMLSPSVTSTDREAAVAEMVHRFSAVALLGAGLLGITGIVTAWTHLKHLDALWTTPYGQALLRKLVVVLFVVALGAWNWRRVGPSLGTDGGAVRIRRTATTELMLAAIVLLLTAILVSTPSPK